MKIVRTIAALALTGTALMAGSASAALPQCSSGFCGASSNGGKCQISGAVHTCGKCSGTPNGILYKGSLDPATAQAKCEQHVNKDRTGAVIKGAEATAVKAKAQKAPAPAPAR